MPFDDARLIKTNAYCAIYRASQDGVPYIVKTYRGGDSRLMIAEAGAIDFYHRIAGDHPGLIDSRTVARNDAENVLCIQYVAGKRLSDLIYEGRRDAGIRERTIHIMTVIGDLMKTMHRLTRRPGSEPDAFLFEYFGYCSARLELLPVVGRIWFQDYKDSARKLMEEFRAARMPPSFAHGDLVFRNIHVAGDRVGLIDFANSNFNSHTLNDLYNLYFALANMVLPETYRTALLDGLRRSLAGLSFPEAGHRFYCEYHRRRWLMLKFTSRHPRDMLQAIRGLLTFAKASRRRLIPL